MPKLFTLRHVVFSYCVYLLIALSHHTAVAQENQEVTHRTTKYPKSFEQSAPFLKLYQSDGPYRQFSPMQEVPELRDLFSKHFKVGENQYTAVTGSGEIHYEENGLMHTILTDIVQSTKPGFAYQNEWNKFKTYYGDDFTKGITVQYGANRLTAWRNKQINYVDDTYQILGSTMLSVPSQPLVNQAHPDKLFYPAVAPYTAAQVTQKTIGYETDIVLTSPAFLANVPTNAAYITVSESVELPSGWKAAFDTKYGASRIVIKDVSGNEMLAFETPKTYELNHINERVQGFYRFNQQGNQLTVELLMPTNWFREQGRSFPLVIDPTVNFFPTNLAWWTGTIDEDGDCNTDDEMWLGFEDGTFANDNYQCYSRFAIGSIPDDACIVSAVVNTFQFNFENDRNDDNNLQFWFQAYDPFNTNVVTAACPIINSNINSTAAKYSRWDVWGTCGGSCQDYNESANNAWKVFAGFDPARVQTCLAQDFVVSSWDYLGGHSDPAGPDNDEIIFWRGRSNVNRPYMTITYETRSVAPTSITASANNICSGAPVTLTVNGGSLGSNAVWRWYTGGCGTGTAIGTGAVLNVNPTSSTTYFVRAEGPCNTTTCASVTVSVTSLINTTVTITSTPPNPGPWCAGSSVVPATSLTANVNLPPLNFGVPAWNYRWERSDDLGLTWSCVNNINTPSTTCPWASNTAVLNYTPVPAITQTTLYRYLLFDNFNSGCVVSSNIITFTVLPTITDNIILDNQILCGASQPQQLLGSVPTGGNSTYLYQWEQSTNSGATWSNVFGANSQSYQPPILSATTQYRRRVTSGPCSGYSNTVTITIQPLIGGNTIGVGQTYCESGDAPPINGTATVTGGNGVYSYQWQESLDSGNTYSNIAGATTASYDPPNITATRYFRRIVTSGTCTDVSNAVAINILLTISNNTIDPDQTSCGTLAAPSTLTGSNPAGGTGVYSYQWQESINGGVTWTDISNANNQSYTPGTVTQTTQYRRVVFSLPCTGISNTVQITIVPPIANNTIVNYQSFCSPGGDPAVISGPVVTGGTGVYNYQWQESTDNGGTWTNVPSANNATFDPPATTSTIWYRRLVFSGICSSTSNVSRVVVLPLPQISGVTFTNITCAGANSGTITVSGTSGNGTVYYSIDGGSNFQPTGFFSGLAAGPYNVVIRDDSTCTNTYIANPVVIVQPPSVTIDSTPFTNASCQGVFDGSITVFASGGVPPYTYSLNGGPVQPGNSFTGIGAGNYTVQVFDAGGCPFTSNVTVGNAYTVTASVVNIDTVTCFGQSNGSITVNLAGGTPAYVYSINGVIFQSSPTFPGLAAGNYAVTLRDSKGCTDFLSVNVPQPDLLQANVNSVTNVLCNGDSTGGINITTTGGNPPYSFVWSNGGTNEDLVNVPAGIYNLAISDSKGCSGTLSATISQPFPLTLTLASSQNVNCFGGSNGTIDVSVSGGVTPYTYNWSNGATTEDLLNLVANTYTLTLTDGNGCVRTLTRTITEPTQVTATILANPATLNCFGDLTSLDLSVTGGTPAYSYSWNNGSFQEDLNNVPAGNYSVIVTDFRNCTATASIVVTQPATLAVSGVVSNLLCNGAGTGAINITTIGGTGPYNFDWADLPGTNDPDDRTGLAAGPYSVTVTDANLCTASASFTISQPLALNAVIASFQNVSCAGGTNGSINITVSGGTMPYAYNWSNTSSTEDLVNIPQGTYTVTITDANSCSATLSQTITQPQPLTASATAGTILCNGGTTNVDLTVSGGTPGYNYFWNVGATTEDLSGVSGGTYSVVVTDANGCTANASVTILQPTVLTVSGAVTNLLCNGVSTGAIDLTTTGGTGPYNFDWADLTGTNNPDDRTGLAAGPYSVTVTDANLCTASASFTISQPSALNAVIASFQNVSCAGGTNGSINITVSGGTMPYAYNWSNTSSTEDLVNIPQGTYTVTITDANSCSATLSQTITQPQPLTASATAGTILCNGGTTDVTLNISGGTLPYSFFWSNGSGSQNLTGVGAGSYSVIVSDGNGCNANTGVIVTQPAAISATAVVTNIVCNGASDGSITLTVAGGVGGYTFNWSNGATSSTLTNLSGGTYAVTITDANACTATASYTVTEPAAITLVVAGSADVNCFGGFSGSVDINVFGGTPLYTYSWSNGGNTEDLNNLGAGVYSLTVTDANSCSASITVTITEPQPLVASASGVNVTCPGASNGSATSTVSGGTAPYTYIWSNGATTPGITNIVGGTYFVTVTDARACQQVASVVITEGLPLTISASLVNVACNNATTGSITVTVSGGTVPYTYNWSNGGTNNVISGLTAGTYDVTVSDLNGCSVTASYTLTEPNALLVNSTVQQVSCFNGNNGRVDITVNGGTLPYTFTWSNGSVNEDIFNLTAGIYTVTINDANGCSITLTDTLVAPSAITSNIVGTNVSCFGNATGSADLTVGGGTPPYSFLWSTFQGSEDIANLNAGLYFVIITDANGCEIKDSVLITQPALLTVTHVSTDVTCFNANDGTIDITVSGGTLPYSYSWTNGATSEDLTGLPGGQYAVTVTDANLCSATAIATVINPPFISLNFVVTNPLCNGDANGGIDLITTGGTPQYTFSWSNGSSNEDVTNITAGVYVVTVTDSKGCIRIDSAEVIDPPFLYTSGFVKGVTCNGLKDGFLDITAYGGTLPYDFLWSTGQSTEDIGSLAGGNYYVTVTDANGCQVANLYVVNEPQVLGISLVKTDVTCFGASNGTVAAIPTGGTKPYNYLWNTFATDSAVYGLNAGRYVVLLTDSNGCFMYDSIHITEPTEIQIAANTTNVLCFGNASGAVDITVSGGVPGYTYTWTGGTQTEDLANATVGTYTVTVTDNNTCEKTRTFVLTQNPEIVTDVSTFNPICYKGSTGAASVVTSGGVAPYTFAWSNQQTGVSIANVLAGTYTVTITDALGCTVTDQAVLQEPAPIVVTTNAFGSKCFNTATGQVEITVTGGQPDYTYILNGTAQQDGTFTDLLPGNYVVLVTDVNGCQGTANFFVSSANPISVDLSTTQQAILTGMETQLVATVSSTVPVISYLWSPDTLMNYTSCADPANCNAPYAAPRTTTTFTVTVMNADSCIATDTITITVLNQPSAFIPTAFTPNGDGLNDRFEFDVLGAENLEVSIFNRWGQRIYYNPSQPNGITGTSGWDGTFDGKLVPDDTYVYQIRVLYFDNVNKDFTGTINVMR